mgnify:FL=1
MKVSFNYNTKLSLVNRTGLKAFIKTIIKLENKKAKSLNFVFCSDKYLLQINKAFLNHNYFTDIITFDLSDSKKEISGEIYISVDRVKDNARIYNTSIKKEVHRVIFHGVLHLCGYGDKTKPQKKTMTNRENHYLAKYFI